MDELIAFVRAQWDARCAELDEDERVARAAEPGDREWSVFSYDLGHEVGIQRDQLAIVVATQGGLDPDEAEHIARWDPARVLAEVELERAEIEAKRRILDEYEAVCGEVRDFTSAEHRANARARQFALERVVELLAQPYAGRPGWREEWRA